MSAPKATTRALLVVALLGAACTRREDAAGDEARSEVESPLLIMAAASLDRAMPALIERFEAEHGGEVVLVLGATGALAAQLEHGAPGDLLFAADEATVARLAATGILEVGSVQRYTEGSLALVWREGIEPPAGMEALTEARFEAIAIANPEIAPYGVAARSALQALGVWRAVEGRVVLGESVAQAYQFVRTGNADAGVVAGSVVEPSDGRALPLPAGLHAPIRQAAGVTTASTHPDAWPFLRFVLGPEGQEVLGMHGFARVEGPR